MCVLLQNRNKPIYMSYADIRFYTNITLLFLLLLNNPDNLNINIKSYKNLISKLIITKSLSFVNKKFLNLSEK